MSLDIFYLSHKHKSKFLLLDIPKRGSVDIFTGEYVESL